MTRSKPLWGSGPARITSLTKPSVDLPSLVRLNHQLYLVTGNSLGKFFKAFLYAVRVTRVENKLPHSARFDYGHKKEILPALPTNCK